MTDDGRTVRLAVLGGGRMGEALVTGLLAAGWAAAGELLVVEPVEGRRQELEERFPGLQVAAEVPSAGGVAASGAAASGAAASGAGASGVAAADGAVLAVKPGDVEAACRAVAAAGIGRVLSIAAGVPVARLEEWLGDGVAVVRAMPNTPALVGCGAAAIAAGTAAGAEDMAWAESILSAVGIVERVGEHLLDAVTGLSGSGPAYVFLVAESLIDAGVLNGLSRPAARSLVIQTLLGSARLLAESGDEPEALRAAVTSPGGTTAAGLRALEARAVRSAFMEAVAAATERSRELGRG